jgi:hypothetical protein
MGMFSYRIMLLDFIHCHEKYFWVYHLVIDLLRRRKMTAEVAILNTHGVALAVDSATDTFKKEIARIIKGEGEDRKGNKA